MKEEKKIKMSEVKVYLFHELSSYLPLLEGEEFDALVEDIKEFGQIEPATIYDGKILDGRNRYRACKILKRELITKEWKPSKTTGSTPLQYVISENIMRRHLNEAQKAEIGMLLYDEIEKQVKEEGLIKASETMKEKFEKGEMKSLGRKIGTVSLIEKKKEDTKKYSIEDTTAYKVAQKVRVKPATIVRVKVIKEVAKEDKEVAEEWEKAKKGDSSIHAAFQEASKIKAIKKLPEDLQVVIKKEEAKVKEAKKKEITYEPVITIKEAKEIAQIPKPELREEAVKFIKKQKKEQKMAKDYIMDVAMGKEKMPTKTLDLDMKIIDQFAQIYKQVVTKMTKRLTDSYNEQTKVRLLKIMKEILIHLQKELNITGAIIEVEKS